MREYKPRPGVTAWFEPLSEEQLQQLSREMARPLPLPEDYLDFLRQFNGAIIESETYIRPKPPFHYWREDGKQITYMFGFDPKEEDEYLDIRRVQTGYGFHERVPGHWLQIGDHQHLDYLCISLREQNYGHIAVWESGQWDDILDQEDTGNYVQHELEMVPVASSFSEFWEVLQTPEEYERWWEGYYQQHPDEVVYWDVPHKAQDDWRRIHWNSIPPRMPD